MTETSTGIDLARVALKAAREAACTQSADAPGGRSSTTRPTRRTTVRTGGRDPIGLGAALAGLIAERAWDTPTAAGGILDQWTTIAPELVGKVTPTHFNARTGRLDLQPTSPAYATQLRLLGRQLVARINGKAGQTLVRDLRVLAPGAIAAGSDQRTDHQAVKQPEAPVRTRDDASTGYHRALAAIRRTATLTDPAIAAAIARQEQAILSRREPETAFTDAVTTQTDQDEAAARTTATTSQALAERRARADKAARGTTPLREASPPMLLSGAA
ncbi:DciA family protein [Kitasatospora sp. NPDC085895]|uniref:DciA family protein n=1 Tax=Kitasatospora sp. NPDC085895 TaxID=3155057 RepID=UPI00344DC319